jgi:hypothetical protein
MGDLLSYLEDKRDCALIDSIVHDIDQFCLEVGTYAGAYNEVLFPELERYSAEWTNYEVIPWVFRELDGAWRPFRTFAEWKNRPAIGAAPDTYLRVTIQWARTKEEEQNVGREMDQGR